VEFSDFISCFIYNCWRLWEKGKKERAKSATKQEAVQKASEEKVHENKYYFSNQPNLSLILLTKKENIK